jgi:osmotically-inducible protein OsmY
MRLVSLTTEAHVRALLKLHPPTRHLEIGVVARDGMVALTGQVASAEMKARCEQVARRVPGIDTVLNELRVAA